MSENISGVDGVPEETWLDSLYRRLHEVTEKEAKLIINALSNEQADQLLDHVIAVNDSLDVRHHWNGFSLAADPYDRDEHRRNCMLRNLLNSPVRNPQQQLGTLESLRDVHLTHDVHVPVIKTSFASAADPEEIVSDAVVRLTRSLNLEWLPIEIRRVVDDLSAVSSHDMFCPHNGPQVITNAAHIIRWVLYDGKNDPYIARDTQIEHVVNDIAQEDLPFYESFLEAALDEHLMQAVAEQDLEGWDVIKQEMEYKLKLVQQRLVAGLGAAPGINPDSAVA